MLYMLIDKFLLKLQTAIPPALIGKMSVQRIMERTAGESRPGHVVITYWMKEDVNTGTMYPAHESYDGNFRQPW